MEAIHAINNLYNFIEQQQKKIKNMNSSGTSNNGMVRNFYEESIKSAYAEIEKYRIGKGRLQNINK